MEVSAPPLVPAFHLGGFTDSLAAITPTSNECPHCHSVSRVGQRLCLSCLLKVGMGDKELTEDEEFDACLAEIEVRDTHWRLGNYEILEEIGRGGMGVIYRARQRHSRRIVALKRLLSYHADSRDTLARFRREAEAAASLDHPNILPIYEVAESDEGVPYFSMKYAPGGSLAQVGEALSSEPRRAVAVVAKITRAVQYAHTQGILHRDLKPGNILLDGRGEPLVSDFGLAKWLDTSSDLTRTMTIFGTPGYIAPEQAEGSTASAKPAADIYSIGAILFDLLSGRPPFLGEHALAVIRQAAEKPAPRLRSLVTNVERDLETMCAKCLEREPQARYHSAGELAEDLERFLEGRPITARPVSAPTRLWRWSRRNPFLAAAAVLALFLSAAVIFAQLERWQLSKTVEAATVYRRSIAVAPLLDLDTASNNSQFAKSFIEAVQPKLSKHAPARVIAIADNSWPGAATADTIRKLTGQAETRTMLIGTLRELDKKLSVSLHLVEGNSGETFLQQRYLLDEQHSSSGDLAAVVSRELSAVLDDNHHNQLITADPALSNPAAAEYIRAGQLFDHRRDSVNLNHALECFESAIKIAPSSALARCYFVFTAVGMGSMQNLSQLITKANIYGEEAMKLRPDIAETHRAAAGLLYLKGNLRQTLEQLLQAIELGGIKEDPLVAVAETVKDLGRPDLSLRWQQIATAMEEHPADYEFSLADCWAELCEDKKAEEIYRRVSALHPDLPEGWVGLCRLRLLQGDFEGARQTYRENIDRFISFPFAAQMAAEVEFFSRNWFEARKRYDSLARGDLDGGSEFYGLVTFQSALGCIQRMQGDAATANTTLSRCLTAANDAFRRAPDNLGVLYRLAAIESSLGQSDVALQHLQSAFAAGYLDYRSLKLDPRFDALHSKPGFEKICDAMARRVTSLRTAALEGQGNSSTRH